MFNDFRGLTTYNDFQPLKLTPTHNLDTEIDFFTELWEVTMEYLLRFGIQAGNAYYTYQNC